MDENLKVSVIIPTHNREDSLGRVVASLEKQGSIVGQMELMIVDDGSTKAIEIGVDLPFEMRVIRQARRGATEARNRGADESRGRILVFMDDDIEVGEGALAALVEEVERNNKSLVLGRLIPTLRKEAYHYGQMVVDEEKRKPAGGEAGFTECMTGLLAIRREDFNRVGKFVDPTGGWPNWDDVEFGYRCVQNGLQILRCAEAVGYHHDHSLVSLKASCVRIERAAKSAANLEKNYPEIFRQLPMFKDKRKITWGEDGPTMMVRKVMRRLSAGKLAVWGMEEATRWLEGGLLRYARNDKDGWTSILRAMYRWILGAYIYRGYRDGTRGCEGKNLEVEMAGHRG